MLIVFGQGGAVVAMWVTNRERHMRFIHEELLPHWGLTHTATWLWLKVTNSGALVSPMVSPLHPNTDGLHSSTMHPCRSMARCVKFHKQSPLHPMTHQ